MSNFFAPGFRVALIVIFLLQILFSAWMPLKGDVFMYSDVSRDFLLMREMVEQRKPDLIGPRAGGVAGFFHGPLWYYLNLPIFILSRGNPVVQAWFWWVLAMMSLGFIWWMLGKFHFRKLDRLIVLTIMAGQYMTFSGNALNWYGAVLMFPVFFYCIAQAIRQQKLSYYLLSGLSIGAIVQFQIALGAPLLVLTTPILLFQTYKHRVLKPLAVFITFALMITPYVLFELRHDWIQTQAVLASVFPSEARTSGSFWTVILFDRILSMIGQPTNSLVSGVLFTSYVPFFLMMIYFTFVIMLGFLIHRKWKPQHSDLLLLFGYFYFGFWILSIFYPGVIWAFYSWPLTASLIIFWWLGVKKINPKVGYLIAGFIVLTQLMSNIQKSEELNAFIGNDVSSWKFQSGLAQETIAMAKDQSSIFFFTNDQYGYVPKYAILYWQDLRTSKFATFDAKQSNTVLVYYLEESHQGYWTHKLWKQDLIHISAEPTESLTYPNFVKVERYELSETDLATPAASTLITNTIFR